MKIASILITAFIATLTFSFCANSQKLVSYVNSAKKFPGPQAFKDKETGIVIYVESDGRHVVAINNKGKILWHRDPFVDAGLTPYRYDKPLIVRIGAPNDWMIKGRDGRYVSVNYNSTQCLILNVENGNPKYMGQD